MRGDEGRRQGAPAVHDSALLPPRSMVWFEAATVVPLAPPVGAPAGSVLKSALAGGLASGLSTVVMHPLDTLKTRVQASPITFGEVMGSLPSIGLAGLYRGAVPAIAGQFARSAQWDLHMQGRGINKGVG